MEAMKPGYLKKLGIAGGYNTIGTRYIRPILAWAKLRNPTFRENSLSEVNSLHDIVMLRGKGDVITDYKATIDDMNRYWFHGNIPKE